MPAKPREWLSTGQAADRAGVCTKTIYRRILDGSLPAERLGPRLLRIDARNLDKLFRPVPAGGGSDAG